MKDSPVSVALKAGLRGNGDWEGYSYVYSKIAEGCEVMAKKRYVRLNDDHVASMADLGSGHEERMKYRLMWMREYGYVK